MVTQSIFALPFIALARTNKSETNIDNIKEKLMQKQYNTSDEILCDLESIFTWSTDETSHNFILKTDVERNITVHHNQMNMMADEMKKRLNTWATNMFIDEELENSPQSIQVYEALSKRFPNILSNHLKEKAIEVIGQGVSFIDHLFHE